MPQGSANWPSRVNFWRAEGLFPATKISKVFPNNTIRNKFSGPGGFMDVKRANPNQPFGSSDTPFTGGGKFQKAVPGLRHAHLSQDLSIVYRVDGNNIYLYGFFTHQDLGTGTPGNVRRQGSMADRFNNVTFVE